jgi:hypothetical protein
MAAEVAPQYRVTGPYVILKTATPNGPQVTGFHKDALVPADVSQEQIDHHLSVGLIEPVDAPPKGRRAAGG